MDHAHLNVKSPTQKIYFSANSENRVCYNLLDGLRDTLSADVDELSY